MVRVTSTQINDIPCFECSWDFKFTFKKKKRFLATKHASNILEQREPIITLHLNEKEKNGRGGGGVECLQIQLLNQLLNDA